MRKHYKLISSIVCLLLCVSMIAFGVYAATNSLIGVSSQVSFTPTSAKLKIFGKVAGFDGYNSNSAGTEDTYKQTYYACNYGAGKDTNSYESETVDGALVDSFTDWEFGDIHFDKNYDEATGPTPIYFYLQITNYVERNVKYTINIDNLTQTGADKTDLADGLITISYGTYSQDNTGTFTNENKWWDITEKKKRNAPLKPESVTSYTDMDSENLTATLPTEDTSLKTTMIIIKLAVDNAEEDFNFNFKFTLTAK